MALARLPCCQGTSILITSAPNLETDRLILRAHTTDDFEDCAAMWADPAVVRHISNSPSTPEQSWSRLLRYAGHWALLGFGYWVVQSKDDSRYIGEVGFADYKREISPSLAGRPEAGWVLKAGEHGRGFASEAVSRIHQWADTHLGVPETVCILAPEHTASINVAQKVGYAKDTVGRYHGNPTLIMVRSIGRIGSDIG